MASIYTYRIQDGRDCIPPVNATVFIVMHPSGDDLMGSWDSCTRAREFCQFKNRKLREEANARH